MKNLKSISLGIAMLISVLTFGQEKDSIISEKRKSNLAEALAGGIAGVQITNSSEAAGSSGRIVLRCNSSITENNNALFVINGVLIDTSNSTKSQKKIARINPDDIESISVLKGEAASALYGTRAKKGVIIITTKKLSKRQIKYLKKLSKYNEKTPI